MKKQVSSCLGGAPFRIHREAHVCLWQTVQFRAAKHAILLLPFPAAHGDGACHGAAQGRMEQNMQEKKRTDDINEQAV
ncbi:MAG: hypothetical protein IKG82_01915, partial [Oscillospiraceae bacterium]|nr:hypothetical protein [Oscillospiraceae bacterium]